MILEIATEDWEVGDGSDLALLFAGSRVTCLPLMSLHETSVSDNLVQ